MARLLAGSELCSLIREAGTTEPENAIILNGSSECVEGIKYDFRFSGRFLKASLGSREVNVSQFSASDQENTRVEPGETVFVLSEEELALPADIKAEFSHKRKLAHEGVLILGGFCVDPQYRGVLIFAIHNYSSEPFPLEPGRKIIAAQFYRLAPEEIDPDAPVPSPITEFPRDVVRAINRFDGVKTQTLLDKIAKLETILDVLREDFDEKKQWLDDLGGKIRDVAQSVQSLENALEAERSQRTAGEDKLASLLDRMTDRTQAHDTRIKIIFAVGALILAVLGTVVGYFVIEGIKASAASPTQAASIAESTRSIAHTLSG